MRISTIGASIKNVQFASLMPVKATDFVEKSFTDKETGKTTVSTSPDGRTQYRTTLKALLLDEEGEITREDQSITVSVLEPSDIKPGIMYGLDGEVLVTHYVSSSTNRIAVSIIAERFKPVNEIKEVSIKELADKLNAPKIQVNPKA